jgi:tripartite-type tricarboxylate transporter receptor subunit TctC
MQAIAVLLWSIVAAVPFFWPGPARAQAQYPNKPIYIICSSDAGGSSDTITRSLTEPLSEILRQPIVVENMAGANGSIAAQRISKATPDGYLLYSAVDNNLVVNPHLYNISYDPFRDFVPISIIARVSMVLVVGAQGPNTLQELIAKAKANPGKLNYASVGYGSQHHLGTEQFKMMTNTDMTHIPYKGTSAAITALLGGVVDTEFAGVGFTKPLLESGKVKALAIAAPHRAPMLPDVPTMEEAGLPGFALSAWYAILAPAKTPSDIVERLSQAIKNSVADPRFRERLNKQGLEVIGSTPSEMLATMRADTQKWKKIIDTAGVKVVQ